MDLKETDRVTLLQQYEELSKEVTAYESSNRSLGKLSDNTAVPDNIPEQRCRQPT